MEKEQKLELYAGSGASLIPFTFFIAITIGLSFINAADLNMMTASGVLGLILGMLFAKDKSAYWGVVLEGLGQKLAMTAVLIWLIVGIYGAILKSGHIVEGLVWLGLQLQVQGAAFTVIAFLFSATFAVATGAAFIGLGSDTGGSIRQPAAFCGVTGIKPTYGRCSRWGIVAYASSLDQAGPMAKTVRDNAIMLGVMAGFDEKDSTSVPIEVPDFEKAITGNVKGLKIGIPKEFRSEGLDADIAKQMKSDDDQPSFVIAVNHNK